MYAKVYLEGTSENIIPFGEGDFYSCGYNVDREGNPLIGLHRVLKDTDETTLEEIFEPHFATGQRFTVELYTGAGKCIKQKTAIFNNFHIQAEIDNKGTVVEIISLLAVPKK